MSGREGMARLIREELSKSETLLVLEPGSAAASCTLAVDAAAIDAIAAKLRDER